MTQESLVADKRAVAHAEDMAWEAARRGEVTQAAGLPASQDTGLDKLRWLDGSLPGTTGLCESSLAHVSAMAYRPLNAPWGGADEQRAQALAVNSPEDVRRLVTWVAHAWWSATPHLLEGKVWKSWEMCRFVAQVGEQLLGVQTEVVDEKGDKQKMTWDFGPMWAEQVSEFTDAASATAVALSTGDWETFLKRPRGGVPQASGW